MCVSSVRVHMLWPVSAQLPDNYCHIYLSIYHSKWLPLTSLIIGWSKERGLQREKRERERRQSEIKMKLNEGEGERNERSQYLTRFLFLFPPALSLLHLHLINKNWTGESNFSNFLFLQFPIPILFSPSLHLQIMKKNCQDAFRLGFSVTFFNDHSSILAG